MGADDYHVSAEHMDRVEKFNKIEELARQWFDGKITDKRMAETVAGLMNVKEDEQ